MNNFFCIILLSTIIILFYFDEKRNIRKKGGNINKMKFPIIIFIVCSSLTLLWFLYPKDIFNITINHEDKEIISFNNSNKELIHFNDGTIRNIWGEIIKNK
tara:strand:+ start:4055 stop:4357 length:303 start_codon:yes stop_codon:yes gene_type:complete